MRCIVVACCSIFLFFFYFHLHTCVCLLATVARMYCEFFLMHTYCCSRELFENSSNWAVDIVQKCVCASVTSCAHANCTMKCVNENANWWRQNCVMQRVKISSRLVHVCVVCDVCVAVCACTHFFAGLHEIYNQFALWTAAIQCSIGDQFSYTVEQTNKAHADTTQRVRERERVRHKRHIP